MIAESGRATAAMQGGGLYNRNSALQAANLSSALPLLEAAAGALPLDGAGPLAIVDYGSSEGRNSMRPIGAAIDALRARDTAGRPVQVVHTDLPSNDFASLFTMLGEDPGSYLAGRPDVFAAAIGRSFFEPILPPASVDLGWSSNALHWLSRNPVDVPDHGWAIFSASEAAREAVEHQLAEDWRRFLVARATELRRGAILVCQFLGRGPDTHGFEWMAGAWWQAIADMGRDGLFAPQELLRMTCPSAGRSVAEIEAPFAGGRFAGLSLDHVSVVEAPDPYWERYCQTGDARQLGRAWADMMRAANGPNFAAALTPGRDGGALFDQVSARLAARIAAAPQRSRSYNAMLVLRKL
jgi:cyclopropane-fatty-acyl-phospholipid synthase